MKKPNILFAFADDWGRYASAYAEHEGEKSINHLIQTPNFDWVAKEGALFKNAFVPAPTCTPCRSSVLSGRYFWQTGLGAILKGAVWDRKIPSYPFLVEDSGYNIGFSYKVWSPGVPKDDPYGGDTRRYQSAGNDFSHFSFKVTDEYEKTKNLIQAKKSLYDEVKNNFLSFIEDQDSDKPFCYWWGPNNTHREWQRGSGKKIWDINPDDLKGRLPEFLPDVHDIREDFADYLGECMAFDGGLGVLLDCLKEMGELDNTFIVVSGDHGIPGVPRAKCNLYDIGCEVALAARLPNVVKENHIIDDMVNIMDVAPTFLEIAGVEKPSTMPANSLLPIMKSSKNGQVDPERTFVITGRERHVHVAREWNLPYPQRAIRTNKYLYIRNFKPDRWPVGDPKGMDNYEAKPPTFEELEHETYSAYPDMDASPTKAWMIHNRNNKELKESYELGFGKRPGEELYDLKKDPNYLNNLSKDNEYKSIKESLSKQLMDELENQGDPRLVEENCRFELSPYTDVDDKLDNTEFRKKNAGHIP
ncbi:MAG: sulfatase [Planctomycetota bacterium]|nr:MAG: sulfatase [Planctomycetota bacterium]